MTTRTSATSCCQENTLHRPQTCQHSLLTFHRRSSLCGLSFTHILGIGLSLLLYDLMGSCHRGGSLA